MVDTRHSFTLNPTHLSTFRAIVGDANVLTDPEELRAFNRDWSGRFEGMSRCVVRPGSTEETARVMRHCAAHGIRIVPQGGNTGLCGGATPMGDELILSLSRLRAVRAVDTEGDTITVEAGVPLQKVQETAAANGRYFPVSFGAQGTATVGGILATNAGGINVLRYGSTREQCLGLEVVLADGAVWDGLRGLRKDNTGYDLRDVFIGSEGTLGVITAAVLKLQPPRRSVATAWALTESPEGVIEVFSRLRQQLGHRLSAFEMLSPEAVSLVMRHFPALRPPIDVTGGGSAAGGVAAPGVGSISGGGSMADEPYSLLIELSDTLPGQNLDEALEQAIMPLMAEGIVADAAIAGSESQTQRFWQFREHIPDSQKLEGSSWKHDISLPIGAIPAFMRQARERIHAAHPGFRIACFGHVGDGNLHYNVIAPEGVEMPAISSQHFHLEHSQHQAAQYITDIIYNLCEYLGGSISAEHGIGRMKRDRLATHKSAIELDLMRRIRLALDPARMLNPGKVVSADAPVPTSTTPSVSSTPLIPST